MGILARVLRFLWQRWADYQSVLAILDVLDFKTAVVAAFAFVAMTFFGATNMEWSAPAVVLAALSTAALVSIIVTSVRMFWRSRPAQPSGARDLATHLDALYAEGVGLRNHLVPTIPGFDWETEHAVLKEWDDRVLVQLDSEHVPVGRRSSFRTLNQFEAVFTPAPGKIDPQCHMESIWTEKLRRLQVIIAELG